MTMSDPFCRYHVSILVLRSTIVLTRNYDLSFLVDISELAFRSVLRPFPISHFCQPVFELTDMIEVVIQFEEFFSGVLIDVVSSMFSIGSVSHPYHPIRGIKCPNISSEIMDKFSCIVIEFLAATKSFYDEII